MEKTYAIVFVAIAYARGTIAPGTIVPLTPFSQTTRGERSRPGRLLEEVRG